MHKSIFLWCLLPLIACGADFWVNPAGGKSFSGKFFTSQGTIQCGKPSYVEVEYAAEKLHITLVSRRFPGWKADSKGSAADDTAMFGAETAEVFLVPENSPDYYQLALNPAGFLYSARRRDKSWEPQVKTAVKVLEDRWIAEFIIPVKELGNAALPRENTVWRANFAVSAYDGDIRKQASWSPTESFHNISGMGKLVFTSRSFTGIKSWHQENGILNAEFSLPADTSAGCVISGVEYPAVDGKVAVKLNSREAGEKNFAIADFQILKNGKNIFSEKRTVSWQVKGALELDRFYVTGSRTVNYRQQLAVPVDIQIHQNGKLLEVLKNVPVSGQIDLKNAVLGKVTVTAVSRKDGTFSPRILIISDKGLAAGPLPPGNISIGGNLLYKGGKPVFFIGTTGSTSWHLHEKESFSLDLGTVGIMNDGLRLRQLPVHRLIRNPSVGYLWKEDWQQQLHRAVTASPVNRLHRICYEVQMDTFVKNNGKITKVNTADFVADVYRTIKKKYPDRLFTQECDRIEELHLYAASCDVLEAASWHSSYAENLMPDLLKDMAYVRKTAGQKPVIFWLGISVPHRESRCAGELRAGVYSAVFSDMAGVIFHVGHGGITPEKQRLWSLVSGINREISSWFPTYAAGEKLSGITRQGDIIMRRWKYQDKLYLGIVNTSAHRQKFEVRFGGQIFSGIMEGYDAAVCNLSSGTGMLR